MRTNGFFRRSITAVTAGLLIAALTACAAEAPTAPDPSSAPTGPGATSDAAPAAPVPPAQPLDVSLQPAPGATAAEAAEQLTRIHLSLLQQGRFGEACLLYLPGFERQLLDLIGASAPCEAALERGFVDSVDEAMEAADRLGELPLTPAFHVPSAILVDASQITVDDERLAYVPGTALQSDDPAQFRDGSGVTPVWMSRSFYVKQSDDGIWRLAASSDR